MKHLSKFKLVAVAQKHVQSKTDHRRVKLIEKLDDQLAMAEALIKGEIYRKYKQVWIQNEHGERVSKSCHLTDPHACPMGQQQR